MNRITSTLKRDGLKFDYDLFDAVELNDGRRALITGYGIYDNQYWCEVCYSDGIHLQSGDWFWINNGVGKNIIGKINEQKNFIISELIREFNWQEEKFNIDFSEDIKLLESNMK